MLGCQRMHLKDMKNSNQMKYLHSLSFLFNIVSVPLETVQKPFNVLYAEILRRNKTFMFVNFSKHQQLLSVVYLSLHCVYQGLLYTCLCVTSLTECAAVGGMWYMLFVYSCFNYEMSLLCYIVWDTMMEMILGISIGIGMIWFCWAVCMLLFVCGAK